MPDDMNAARARHGCRPVQCSLSVQMYSGSTGFVAGASIFLRCSSRAIKATHPDFRYQPNCRVRGIGRWRADPMGIRPPRYNPGPRRSVGCLDLVLKTSRAALQAPADVLPQPLDHTGVVVAIPQIVIQSGEAVLLARLLHVAQLCRVELVTFDRAPVVGCGVHRKTRPDGAVGSDDHVVLAGPAIPLGKPQTAVLI